MTINDLSIGEEAKIIGFKDGDRGYRAKLLSMGLTKGVVVKLVKIAPMGDPVGIEIRGFNLSLRKDEAHIILLEKGDQDDK